MRDLAEFEVLKGLDVRDHAEAVLRGIEAINRKSPTGYPSAPILQRFIDRCNRDWDWLFVAAHDTVEHDPHKYLCGWCVVVRFIDFMGTPQAYAVQAWCAPGYHGEPLQAMAPAIINHTRKKWGATELVSITGRFDQQDKAAGSVVSYAQFAEPFGLQHFGAVFKRSLT